ncbi:TPA: hypothetical protein DCX15_01305, partial [bacterium]|nr:hypothetical protein [bacterium]
LGREDQTTVPLSKVVAFFCFYLGWTVEQVLSHPKKQLISLLPHIVDFRQEDWKLLGRLLGAELKPSSQKEVDRSITDWEKMEQEGYPVEIKRKNG